MTVKLKKEKIEKALKDVLKTKARHVLAEFSGDRIDLSSSTEVIAVTSHVTADESDGLPFRCIIDGRHMAKVISICDGEDVAFSENEHGLQMQCGSADVLFVRNDAPVRKAETAAGTEITDPDFFKKCEEVMHAASQKPADTPMLKGVNISGTADCICAAALDGKRVSVRGRRGNEKSIDVTVYASDLAALCVLAKSGEGHAFVSDRCIAYEDGDNTCVCRTLSTRFFDLDTIFKKMSFRNTVVCDRNELSAIARLSAIAESDVLVEIGSEGIEVTSAGETMNADSTVRVSRSEKLIPKTEFKLNPSFLIDALSALKCDRVSISYFARTSPVLIRPEDGEAQDEIMMPMMR